MKTPISTMPLGRRKRADEIAGPDRLGNRHGVIGAERLLHSVELPVGSAGTAKTRQPASRQAGAEPPSFGIDRLPPALPLTA